MSGIFSRSGRGKKKKIKRREENNIKEMVEEMRIQRKH